MRRLATIILSSRAYQLSSTGVETTKVDQEAVFARARLRPLTLEQLSQQFGISRERVRQIEVRAFEKLQKSIRAAAVEARLIN